MSSLRSSKAFEFGCPRPTGTSLSNPQHLLLTGPLVDAASLTFHRVHNGWRTVAGVWITQHMQFHQQRQIEWGGAGGGGMPPRASLSASHSHSPKLLRPRKKCVSFHFFSFLFPPHVSKPGLRLILLPTILALLCYAAPHPMPNPGLSILSLSVPPVTTAPSVASRRS